METDSGHDDGMERYLIPKGTVLHIAGFSVRATETTTIEAHRGNWALIKAEMTFPPCSGEPSPDPPTHV